MLSFPTVKLGLAISFFLAGVDKGAWRLAYWLTWKMEVENMNECLARIGNLEKSVGKLETIIEERFQHFEENLKKIESRLTAKLDKIDEDICENGELGINVQLGNIKRQIEQLEGEKDKKLEELATCVLRKKQWIDGHMKQKKKK